MEISLGHFHWPLLRAALHCLSFNFDLRILEYIIKCRYSIRVKHEKEPETICHRLKYLYYFSSGSG